MVAGEVGAVMGLTANGVSVLAWRARRALRVAYLQEHVTTRVPDDRCQQTRRHLAGWLSGRLSSSVRARIERHLMSCSACAAAAAELSDWAMLLSGPVGSL